MPEPNSTARRGNTLTLTQTLVPWHEFYALLGSASATMVALLFVAASVGAGVFTANRRAALRMFLSASVVHFSSILVVCLIVVAPIGSWTMLGILVSACGAFGLAYSAMGWRDAVRERMSALIDLEDRIWYGALPAAGYLIETVSGGLLWAGHDAGCGALAVSVCILLLSGIHNAWDITVWSITRRGAATAGRTDAAPGEDMSG